MTGLPDKPRLAVLGAARDYGARLSRARWRRALGAENICSIDPARDARSAFAGASWWVVVVDESAIVVDGSGARPPAGRVLGASVIAPAAAVHTLRELEEAAETAGMAEGVAPPAFSFETADVPPLEGESAGDYVSRLHAACRPADRSFAALCLPDASEQPRPEIARRVPASARRLLDVGCGAGGFSAGVKRDRPDLFAVGVEPDARAAARARGRLDRVLPTGARSAIETLAAEGERFDAIVFADVLEHLDDAVDVLSLARTVAAPDAVLIATVPNVGHASVVRDLLRGRFDPVPAGLLDAGHLRWFDRTRLAETLAEAGWTPRSLEGLPGAPVPGGAELQAWAAGFPAADRESLATYQWIVVAGAEASDGAIAGAAR